MKTPEFTDSEQAWKSQINKILKEAFPRAPEYEEVQVQTLAKFAASTGEDINSVTDIDTFYDLRERHFKEVHRVKPRKPTPNSKSGSLPRLMRYIDLKIALASPGLTGRLGGDALQVRNPFADEEVVELRLTFVVKQGSSRDSLLGVYSVPPDVTAWLGLVVATIDSSEEVPEGYSTTFRAGLKRYDSTEAWKMERLIGHQKAGRELLTGFPAVVDVPKTSSIDTTLIVLEPDIPPRRLGALWDKVDAENKMRQRRYELFLEADQTALNDLNALPIDNFIDYFLSAAIVRKRDGPEQFANLSYEETKERLLKDMPEFVAAYKKERLSAFRAKRYAEIDFDAAETEMRAKKGSARRARPIDLEQEILGRIAYDICCEGMYLGEKGFTGKVLERFREHAESFGAEYNYYGKPEERAKALKAVNRNLNELERKIKTRMYRPSPFRRPFY